MNAAFPLTVIPKGSQSLGQVTRMWRDEAKGYGQNLGTVCGSPKEKELGRCGVLKNNKRRIGDVA